jgi:HD-GYP domain-containing protein (c-di-GMP phosphodiesterase class II)
MIQVSLNELHPGHVIAKTIYSEMGDVMLASGFTMTPGVMAKLAEQGYNRFGVHEEGLESVAAEELVDERVVNRCVAQLRKAATEFRAKMGVGAAGKSVDEILSNPFAVKSAFAAKEYRKVAATIWQEIRRADPPILHLLGMRSTANYLHQHAVESAITAGILAKSFHFSPNECEDLILGVLLMDCGYLLLPDRLYTQAGKLSLDDYKVLKKHPDYGFDLLRTLTEIPLVCAHIALQHQERQDGGGYPRGLKGKNQPPLREAGATKDQIHRFAEIAAVANDYLSLIAPRPGLPTQTPIQSIKFLLRLSGSRLNSSIVNSMLKIIPVYTAGCRIMVTKDEEIPERVGYLGLVSKSCPLHQDRPEVILVYDASGQRVEAIPLKLEEHPGIEVKEVEPGKLKEDVENAMKANAEAM